MNNLVKNDLNSTKMNKKQAVKIVSPNFGEIINIRSFLEKDFLRRGYKKYHDNFFMKFFYTLYIIKLRKVRILFTFLKNTKFKFQDYYKKDLLIFDCAGSSELEKLLSDLDYYLVSSRMDKIREMFISKKILKYMIKNFFKRSLKENYLIALIESASPKVVITNNDNSPEFHNISKVLKESDIKFIAVQCANRGDTVWKDLSESKNTHIPEFLCFSDFDKYIHQWKKCDIKKYSSIGSLQASFAKDYIKSKDILDKSENYDICLISEFQPELDGDWSHVEDLQDKLGQLAEYVYRLGKECELKIIFIGKSSKEDREAEIIFFKNYIKNNDFQITPFVPKNYNGYVNLVKSKLVIGAKSTILREAFLFEKKVLACNFTGHKDIIFPSNGICNLNEDTSYEDFKSRVLSILQMSNEEYNKLLSKDANYIMNTEIDTREFIKSRINEILQS